MRDAISIAWIEAGFTDILQAKDLRGQTLEAYCQATMRRHAKLEHLQMTLKRSWRNAARGERAFQIGATMQTLPSSSDFQTMEQKIEAGG